MDAQSGAGFAAQLPDLLPVLLDDFVQTMRGGYGPFGDLPDPDGEEPQPGFPVAGLTDFHKQIEILIPMLLEVQAEIQERLAQNPFVAKQQGDQ